MDTALDNGWNLFLICGGLHTPPSRADSTFRLKIIRRVCLGNIPAYINVHGKWGKKKVSVKNQIIIIEAN